jgi:very-short-patch-repair endonuclease
MRNNRVEQPGLAALLRAQFGVISRAQASGVGLYPMALHRRVKSEGWKHPFPGIYVHPDASGFETEAKALCLWAGKGAVLSHGGAARLLGLAGMEAAPAEVTVEKGIQRRGALVHRGVVSVEDRRTLRGIPHTSAARTLIDLAAVADDEALAIAFEDAWRKRLVQLDWIARRLAELGPRGRRGAKALARLLRDGRRRAKPMDSPLEVKFWRFAQRHLRLRMPVPGQQVRDEEGEPMVIDFAYPRERVAIEVHSFLIHGQKAAHERDALRACRLAEIGWRILFVTSGQMRHEERLARRIRATLAFDPCADRNERIVHDQVTLPAGATPD